MTGSQAYVQALVGQRGVGLIATHDLELVKLAESSPLIRNYHFRDGVEDRRMIFDYKLHPGPCPTTNALEDHGAGRFTGRREKFNFSKKLNFRM
ncbi:MAG: hypothetical protein M5U34_41070 [Chloroflexi bacterium]|nr:hypothetical protein [Chloroflexota bacterium]